MQDEQAHATRGAVERDAARARVRRITAGALRRIAVARRLPGYVANGIRPARPTAARRRRRRRRPTHDADRARHVPVPAIARAPALVASSSSIQLGRPARPGAGPVEWPRRSPSRADRESPPAPFRRSGRPPSSASPTPRARRRADVLETQLAAIDVACSRFRPDSELVRAERAPPDAAVAGRPAAVRRRAGRARRRRLTGGLVDPTVGADAPPRRLRPHLRRGSPPRRPSRPARSFAPVAGWASVELDARARTIRVPARRRARPRRDGEGARRRPRRGRGRAATGAGVLVSLGGDVAVAGAPPDGGWPVRIADDHAAPLDGPGPVVAIAGGGLATSSTHVRRWTTAGGELHHILDPRTGRPAETPWRTVSVAAASCVDANAASTAAIVLGDAAPGWLARAAAAGASRRRRRRGRDGRRLAGGGAVTTILAARPERLWYLTRGAGVVALLLLTATTLLGVLTRRTAGAASAGRASRSPACTATCRCSRSSSSAIARRDDDRRRLRADRRPRRVHPVRVPYRPFWLGLGALALDLLLALTVTSMLRKRIGYRTWRAPALGGVRDVAARARARARLRLGRARTAGWPCSPTRASALVVGAIAARLVRSGLPRCRSRPVRRPSSSRSWSLPGTGPARASTGGRRGRERRRPCSGRPRHDRTPRAAGARGQHVSGDRAVRRPSDRPDVHVGPRRCRRRRDRDRPRRPRRHAGHRPPDALGRGARRRRAWR